jgi:Ca-activated chloride channel family protein
MEPIATLAIAALAALQITPIPLQQSTDAVVAVRPATRVLHLDTLRISVAIVDNTATTEIEQVFNNPSPVPSEESYLWPIPDGASVGKFELWVNGKPSQAELLDKDKARGIYEDIVRRQRDPALLEWAGLGCVKASVFPVPARGQAQVRLRYTTVLESSGGVFEYTLPLRLASIAPQGVRSFVLDGKMDASRAIAAVYSPSHNLDVRREGDLKARFSFEGAQLRLDKDFTLALTPAEKEFGALLLANRAEGQDGYFSLVFAPRFDAGTATLTPKDVVFVVDTSGSMAGEKIEQVKKSLKQIVPRLRSSDRFALTRFATETDAFRAELAAPTTENVAAALSWIDKLEARGGTNIEEALTSALKTIRSDGRLTLVFFLTDGLPTVGTTDGGRLASLVKERNSQSLRIFTFGVGFDVNTQLLDTIARESRAAREYVLPGQDVEVKVSTLFDKVEYPALTNVEVSLEGSGAYDVFPKQLPDLFRGSQLVLAGRYRSDGVKSVKLAGTYGGARREWVYELDFPRASSRHESLLTLWAARKVGYLLDEIRMRGSSKEVVDEIKRLGKEYGIVTPYTSFLVIEEGARLSQATGRGVPSGGVLRFVENGKDGSISLDEEAKESQRRLDELVKRESGEQAVNDSLNANDLALQTAAPLGPATPAGGGGASFERDLGNARARAVAQQLTRFVNNQQFTNVASTWIDNRFTEKDRAGLVKVRFLSDDYFGLLKKAPELNSCFALGPRVIVQWRGQFYEVTES